MVTLLNDQDPGDAVEYLQSVVGGSFKLARNVRLYELVSDTDRVLVHPATVLGVQMIRDKFGAVVRFNSFYRSPEHNQRVGGAKKSKHPLGMAADIDVIGVEPDAVADYAEEIGFGGVGRYDTFTHVDTYGIGRRWDYRSNAA